MCDKSVLLIISVHYSQREESSVCRTVHSSRLHLNPDAHTAKILNPDFIKVYAEIPLNLVPPFSAGEHRIEL